MSSPSNSSLDSSSASKKSKGFKFDGITYSTYNEMVAAKRERNRNFLQQKLSEISSFADKSVSSLDTSEAGSLAKPAPKKRRGRPDASQSISSVRRNPRRSATSAASYTEEESSLSSKSSSSYSEKSTSSEEDVCLADLVPIPDTKKKRAASNSRSGSQTKRRVRKETAIAQPTSEEGIVPRPHCRFKSHTPEYLPIETPDQANRVRGPEADNLLPLSDIRDMSALLEHIVVDGFRIKSRELAWANLYSGGSFPETDGENTMYSVEKRLYQGLDGDHGKDNVKVESVDNDVKIESIDNDVKIESIDNDDELIPKEYLISSDPTDNSSRMKHMDQIWIDEYGDGIDPMMFSDEYIASNDNGEAGRYTSLLLQRCWDRAVSIASSTVTVDINSTHSDGEIDKAIKTDPAEMDFKEETDTDASFLDLRTSIASTLHSNTMNVVDGILDFILSDQSLFIQKILQKPEKNQQIHWYDICKLLQTKMKSTSAETNLLEPPMQQPADSNDAISPWITFDEATVKAITMRLVEMYGSADV